MQIREKKQGKQAWISMATVVVVADIVDGAAVALEGGTAGAATTAKKLKLCSMGTKPSYL